MRSRLLYILLATAGCGGSVADDGAPDADAAIDSFVVRDTTPASDTRSFDVAPFDASTTCPATVPANKTSCGPIHFTCSYKGACGDDFAQCVDGTWTVITSTCSAEYCPIAGPLPGGSCITEGYVCEYPRASDAGTPSCALCVCKAGAFVCDDHPLAECPLPSCKTGDSCTTPGMIGCEYGGKCGTSCRCKATGTLECSSRPC